MLQNNLKIKAVNILKSAYKNMLKGTANLGFPLTGDHRKIIALKNLYQGKRCFVIGNGPSLEMADLQKIHEYGDVSIASNKIYLAFEDTDWRPNVFTVIDSVVMENNFNTISQLPFPKIYLDGFQKFTEHYEDVVFCNQGYEGHWNGSEYVGGFKPGFSPNIINNIYTGESVTYWNIQIAYYLGCKEIVLIGVDFSFKIPSKKIPDNTFGYVLHGEGEVNHFSDKYRPVDETWTMPNLKEQEAAFLCAKNFCDKKGVKIFNASRKSELKVFERIDFEDIYSPSLS